jgi:hypothetical protein
LANKLPLGAPILTWSYNRFGYAWPGLIEACDRRLNVDTRTTWHERAALWISPSDKWGVDAQRAFPGTDEAGRRGA